METAILILELECRLLVSAKSTSALDPKPTIADSYLQLSAMPSFPSTALVAMNQLCGDKLAR